MPSYRRGPDDDPLLEDDNVIRLAFMSSDGKANPKMFEFSSEEKKEIYQKLSVWNDQLTTPIQARSFMNPQQNYELVLRLNVQQIRSLSSEHPDLDALDVRWDHLPSGKPGSDGHSAITQLNKGNKTEKRTRRIRLADVSEVQLLNTYE